MEALPKVKTLTEPTELPVDIDDAKRQAVIAHSDDDDLIFRFIAAATEHIQTITSSSLVRQQKRLYLDKFSDAVHLPLGPVQAIEQVQYVDSDGNTQTLSSSIYTFNDADGYLRKAYNQSWPSTRAQSNAVWIDYWAGYYDSTSSPIDQTAKIPEPLKHALMMLVAEMDKNREAFNELQHYKNYAFECLISPYRSYIV